MNACVTNESEDAWSREVQKMLIRTCLLEDALLFTVIYIYIYEDRRCPLYIRHRQLIIIKFLIFFKLHYHT